MRLGLLSVCFVIALAGTLVRRRRLPEEDRSRLTLFLAIATVCFLLFDVSGLSHAVAAAWPTVSYLAEGHSLGLAFRAANARELGSVLAPGLVAELWFAFAPLCARIADSRRRWGAFGGGTLIAIGVTALVGAMMIETA